MTNRGRPARRSCQRGFSLVEALVALLLLVAVLAAFLVAVNRFQRAVTVQADLASASEDLRHTTGSILRVVRMAGCGGLPIVAPDALGSLRPLAVDLADNSDSIDRFESSVTGESWRFVSNRQAVRGTDVLRIRGVMANPTYDMAVASFADPGMVSISETSPWSGDPQSLETPSSTNGRAFLLALRSPLEVVADFGSRRAYSDYRVVAVDGDAEINPGPEGRVLQFGYNASGYAFLNPSGSDDLAAKMVVSGGFLDDVVFLIATNNYGEPALYRLRVKRVGGRVTAEEVVPNVCDLQVAFGCDVDGDGEIDDSEWFLSAENPAPPSADALVSLLQLRVSLVSRTQSPDLGWQDGQEALENGLALEDEDRRYRYRASTIRINLRSHPKVIVS